MGGWVARKAWHLRRDVKHGGLWLTASFHLESWLRGVVGRMGWNPNSSITFRVRGVRGRVRARWGTSDIPVFHSVFLSGHYKGLSDVENVASIVDCGANVGYSAIYLMRRFPHARLIAIEPAPDNADLCRANLSSFGTRASVVEAAVWPSPGGVVLDRGPDGTAQPWAVRVRQVDANESSDVTAVTIPDVMQRFGLASIDILKIDIEGSERQLFQNGATNWLGQVRNLVVELHDDPSRRTFSRAMSTYEYKRNEAGQLTFCFSLKALTPAESR
jgi:FkbM family methyltransferase